MTLTISENKKKSIVTYINDHFDEHMSHFPFAKYPTEPLNQWRKQFADPKAVDPKMIRAALSWRGGFWQRKDAPNAQRQTTLSVIKLWPEFVREEAAEPARALDFWTSRLGGESLAFDIAAFLAHLAHPDALELADTQRLEAMRDLLKEVGHEGGEPDADCSLGGLLRYTDFFRALLPKMQPKDANRARVQLDRFLKAYGNRHALTKLAGKTPPTIEPAIWSLNWEAIDCKKYAPEGIEGRANADVLFACLLLALDRQPERKEKLTVGEIAELVPLGSGGVCNPGSYHYAMIALFGGQKGRDFFTFEDETLQAEFTAQANQSSRDMRFYRKHSDASITINPKYARS
ncbi:hypothetical protein J23TS9_42650 [Paenibacillus sp. J23TS9]|uniref:hypothetical protein n=1 Tax=Paenibacillus sp. J23TS9 TaxID=2807193 RepID=UPI001B28B0DB|nr:hypothetical protein [Paenibacillus sp. J23TS9]GIP29135.1 hypothetical protein J23TS9_42650 [Paenibacillus sp. J23TS9]